MTVSGPESKRSNDGPASDEVDSFLKEVAHAPTVTLPSVQRGSDGEDPEKLAHFTVLGRIGEGGMGIVYRARDEKLGRIVALKVLPREFEAHEMRRKRFMREARAAAAITHPNIVTVYEIGESLGRVFIAMELVDGRRLRALMSRGPMPVAEALRLMLEIVAGVAKAHAAGIVHRDLKPENTLVTSDSHVKLLDFGLAKQLSAEELVVTRTGEGAILGTPGYMSPEQMQGRPATPAADVFALGVILYELLTERRPFKGKNLPQLVCSIDKDVPRAPSRLNPRVPGALDGIVARCLSKDPGDRYPDARALLEELSSVTPPPPSAVVRRSRRRAAMVGVVALVLGIAAAAAVVVGRRIHLARQREAPRASAPEQDVAILGPLPSSVEEGEPMPWAPPPDGELHLWSSALHRGQARSDLSRYCGPFVQNAPELRQADSVDDLEARWLAAPADELPPAQVEFCRSQKVVDSLRYHFGVMRLTAEARDELTQLARDISAAATRRLARGETPFCPSGAPVPREIDGPGFKYQPARSDWMDDPGWSCVASAWEAASFLSTGPIEFQYRFDTTATTFAVSGRKFYELYSKLWDVTITLTGTVKDGQVFTSPDADEKWAKVY